MYISTFPICSVCAFFADFQKIGLIWPVGGAIWLVGVAVWPVGGAIWLVGVLIFNVG